MKLFPVYIKLHKKKCLVVGGGKVAERKVGDLLDTGASVCIISPDITDKICALVQDKKLIFINRRFQENDLEQVYLVIAATNDHVVNRKINEEAVRRGVLINAVDDPENCSFFVPAIIRRKDVVVAISTSGKAPYFSKLFKKKLESMFYEKFDEHFDEISEIRKKVCQQNLSESEKIRLCDNLIKQKADLIFRRMGFHDRIDGI